MANTVTILILVTLIGVCTCRHIFVINSDLDTRSSEDELVSVVLLYRHGDRSPIESFPTDPYFNGSYWPEGYGELLAKGVSRQYTLGKWLRQRYGSFLPAQYSSNDITVYSTDVDRALMSAQANLAGLYPPVDADVWDDDLPWEPIPVHLKDVDDPVLAMNSDCPKFNDLFDELETSEFFRNVTRDNSKLFDKLSNLTGMNISSTYDMWLIYDVFYVYMNHNESYLPSWVEDVDLDKINYLAGLDFGKQVFTDSLRRLRTGPFFNYLIGHFDDVIDNNTDASKFLMLSGHDMTIAAVLGGMKAFDFHPPEFASMVIWELRKNAKKEHYVNVLYKRNSSDTYDHILVDNCSFNCIFSDFKDNLESVAVDISTWRNECHESNSINIVFSWPLLLIAVVFQPLIKYISY